MSTSTVVFDPWRHRRNQPTLSSHCRRRRTKVIHQLLLVHTSNNNHEVLLPSLTRPALQRIMPLCHGTHPRVRLVHRSAYILCIITILILKRLKILIELFLVCQIVQILGLMHRNPHRHGSAPLRHPWRCLPWDRIPRRRCLRHSLQACWNRPLLMYFRTHLPQVALRPPQWTLWRRLRASHHLLILHWCEL